MEEDMAYKDIGISVGELIAELSVLSPDTPVMLAYCDKATAQPAATTVTRIVAGGQSNYVGKIYFHVADPDHFYGLVSEQVVIIHGSQDADEYPIRVAEA